MKFTIGNGLIFFAGLAVGFGVMNASKSLEPSVVEALKLRLHEAELRIQRLEVNLQLYQAEVVQSHDEQVLRNVGDFDAPESGPQLSWSRQDDVQD